MASSPSSKVTLKLLIDKNGQRVLFAEAGKDFVDFLFSLMALPVGSVIKLLDNRDMIGGLAKIYQSVSDLKDDYIQSNQNKNVLLNPKSSLPYSSTHISMLPTEAFSSQSSTSNSATIYRSETCTGFFSSTYAYTCPVPYCKRKMTTIDGTYVLKSEVDAKGGGFVKGLVTYMVMDDLSVSPMSTIDNITLLNKFNIKDLGALEGKVVHIGMNEGLELLKHSLNSKTVLTDVFLRDVAVKDDNLKKV